MNKLTYNGKIYDDVREGTDKLMDTGAYIGDSLPSVTLSVDTMSAVVRDYDTQERILVADDRPVFFGDSVGIARTRRDGLDKRQTYGAPVAYQHEGGFNGLFRLDSITRIGKYEYSIECISDIGLLLTDDYYGGIYTGETTGAVISDIVHGIFQYTVAPELSSVPLYGLLRKMKRRDSLQHVLFAVGGWLRKDTAGVVRIEAMERREPYEIPVDAFYMGGSVTGTKPATGIALTEHSFVPLPTDKSVTLYRGQSAAEQMITPAGKSVVGILVDFKNPCHNLSIQNAQILESGANYAVISGSPEAILIGLEYTHTERIITRTSRTGGAPNIVPSSKCELVNLMNGELVADRLMGYYGSAKTVSADIVVTNQKPGDAVRFVDPFGDKTEGYIADMELTMSHILKASANIIAGFIPTASGNYYTQVFVIEQDGEFIIPGGCKGKARIVVVGGGDGGTMGDDGKPGEGGSSGYGTGGDGGAAGEPGSGGKVFVSTIPALVGEKFAVKLGKKGLGQTLERSATAGTPTTFGPYTSEDGYTSESGFFAQISNKIYGIPGRHGLPGANGGGPRKDPQPIIWDGVEYRGGKKAPDYQRPGHNVVAKGGFGGGPAVGANGGDGKRGNYGVDADGHVGTINGGDGGEGADAAPGENAKTPGSGGNAGHGGGGGGGGAPGQWPSNGGRGGKAGPAGDGADGVVLVFI